MGRAEEPASDAVPVIAGGSQEADLPSGARCPAIVALIAITAAATIFFGIVPSPLVDWAANAGDAIGSLLG
jgi:hypothetical protein